MPDLKKEDVAQMDLPAIEKALDERVSEVNRITDGVESWDQIPEDREGRDRLPKMMTEMNLLGKRRDDIAEQRGQQKHFEAIEAALKNPVEQISKQTPAPERRGKDFASLFMDSDMRKSALAGNRGLVAEFPIESFGFKGTLGEDATQTNVDTDYPVRADRLAGIVDELFQTPNVADLIPSVTTNSDSIEYITENYTEAAAETNEGDAIAEASDEFTLATSPVRKIAVAIKATAEVLSDEGLLRGFVTNRLNQDLRWREDLQILKGNGVAPNLDGIIGGTGVGNENYSLAAGTDAFLEAIFKASTTVREAFLNPTAAIMNAGSWETLRLEKASTGGSYLLGPVADGVAPRIWGLRVVTNQNMDDNLIATEVPVLLGDWANGALIARNGGVSVAISDSDGTDFLNDVLTFKATMREALILLRGAAFATVTVTA